MKRKKRNRQSGWIIPYLHMIGAEAGAAKKAFSLPPASSNMRRMYAYLLKQRCISREVVDAFVHAKLLYESAEPSADGRKITTMPFLSDLMRTALHVMRTSADSTPLAKASSGMWPAVMPGTVFTAAEPAASCMCLRPRLICCHLSR